MLASKKLTPLIGRPAKLNRTARKLLALLALSGALIGTHAPVWAKEPIAARYSFDRPIVTQNGRQIVYVLINLDAEEWTDEPGVARPPLNVSLVLDRSGSMSDAGKIDYLKRASKLAVDRLSESDTLSVVEYDDKITVLWPASRVNDTSELKRLIDSLTPRGSTNLAGGLDRGIDEAVSARQGPARSEGTIARVILMSDGLANVGVTNPGKIRDMVLDAKRKGIRISALGLGREYDEDLMQDIAEAGGGRYHYIEHPAQIARIFEEEMATMSRTTARDCEFTFKGGAAVFKAELLGYDIKAGREIRHSFEDFYAGEKRAVIMKLEIASGAPGNLDLGELAFRYKDAKSLQAQTFNAALKVDVTADRAAADKAVNTAVAADAALAETERAQREQVRLYEAGKHEEAARNMATIAKDLETRNAVLKDERVSKKIEALAIEKQKMTTSAASPAAQETYLKASKNRLYQAKEGRRRLEVLKRGDKGLEVERLQDALKREGFYAGPVNGVYDDKVQTAVEAYQKKKGVNTDGMAGASTMDALGLY